LDPRAFKTVIASGWRLSLEDGRSLTLADRMVLCRGDDATLRVEDEGVSREHARLCLLEDRVSVVDLGSTNGTWVNGEQVEMALLRDGDRVRFGTDLNAVVERFGA
jgi:pSer/pThr/pTyr-binding forkhead associated (FHA) protein